MSSLYRQQLEKWLKKIVVKTDRVLDVGGGQNPITKRVKSWDVEEYKIADNDIQFKPDIITDINYSASEADKEMAKFDIIFCLEVFEYIWNPLVAHENLFNFLKSDGIAYISYPTLYPLHNPLGIDYLRYTKNAIEKLLEVSGFKNWEITPRIATAGVEALSNFYSLERMRPIKGTGDIFHIGYLVKAFK